jgi:hypothetical protein
MPSLLKGKRWAFDDPFTYLYQPFNIPNNPPAWTTNSKGDLVASVETEQYIEALNWERSIVAAGMMHPGAIALDTSSAKQRFWSGQVVLTGDGTGAWNGSDALSGKAANPSYVRTAFPLFTASGSGTPRIALGSGAGLFSYLSKDLTKSQIEEALRIANYIAAPYGSYEYTLINFGVQGRDWTPSAHGPIYTTQGTKEANEDTYQFLATGPSVTSVQNGYIIPLFLVVSALGGYDQYWALIAPSAVSVFNIIVMRSFFSNVASDLIESARIDGASDWRILRSIVLPVSKAVTAVIALFYAVAYWNSWFNILLFMPADSQKWPLQMVMYNYVTEGMTMAGSGNTIVGQNLGHQQIAPLSLQMAVVVLTLVPILIAYPFAQKHFTKGVLLGAIKG